MNGEFGGWDLTNWFGLNIGVWDYILDYGILIVGSSLTWFNFLASPVLGEMLPNFRQNFLCYKVCIIYICV